MRYYIQDIHKTFILNNPIFDTHGIDLGATESLHLTLISRHPESVNQFSVYQLLFLAAQQDRNIWLSQFALPDQQQANFMYSHSYAMEVNHTTELTARYSCVKK